MRRILRYVPRPSLQFIAKTFSSFIVSFLLQRCGQVTDILEARPELTLGALGSDTVADLIQVGTSAEVAESEVADVIAEVEKTGILKVVGSLSSYMMRIGEEYTKSLQSINPHTQEYIRRLKDESVVVELAGRVQAYYERQGEMNVAADLALLQVGPWLRCRFGIRILVACGCVQLLDLSRCISWLVCDVLLCWYCFAR